MDFFSHWNLSERPFEATWDTRFFFGSQAHLEALNRLVYFVAERTMNVCLLSGDIGCGKTLTRAVFTQHLASQFVVVTLENSGFSFEELVETVLRKLDPASSLQGIGKMAKCELLAGLLDQIHASGKHLVLLLDEAQDMSAQTLHELRLLTNYNHSGRALLSLVLIGQPELRPRVAADAALDQRISLRYHLRPLTPDELTAYLAHRLRVAGHETGAVFAPEASKLVHAMSRGVPREVNRLAKLALEQSWLRDAHIVDARCVDAVMRDMAKHQTLVAA